MFQETDNCKGCHHICRVTLYLGNCGCPLLLSVSQEYGGGTCMEIIVHGVTSSG